MADVPVRLPLDERGVTGYVVLGLLLDGAGTGYDLVARAERSIGHFWPITRSGIYAELPRLEERGLAHSRRIVQRTYPDKRIFTATEAGRQAFRDWLTRVELEERPRHPLQLLLYFSDRGDAAQTGALLARWQAQADRTRATCTQILTERGVDPADLGHGRAPGSQTLTALFGLRRAEADTAFLAEARRALQIR